jgi:hypothetical protein
MRDDRVLLLRQRLQRIRALGRSQRIPTLCESRADNQQEGRGSNQAHHPETLPPIGKFSDGRLEIKINAKTC